MFCRGELIAPCCGHSDVWLLSDPPIVQRITDQVLHLTHLLPPNLPTYLPTYLPTAQHTHLTTYFYCRTDHGSGASPYPPTPSQLTYLSTYLPTYCPTYPSNYLLLLSNGSRIRCFTLPSTHLLPIYPHTYLPTALSTHLTT